MSATGLTPDQPDNLRVADVEWEKLIPEERTVLCFIIRDRRVLLIQKKTGLGAGMINAPGGRLEPGELAPEGAIRETREETGLTPSRLREMGRLFFYFTSGYFQDCRVYAADECSGREVCTEEADPLWVEVDRIPYDRMWEGDRLWVPRLLQGEPFQGRLIFAEEKLLDAEINPA